jgi:hypothetical protein
MKTYSLLKIFALIGSVAIASTATAQYFAFDIDDSNGHVNVSGAGASGTVDFLTDGTDWTSTVNILNDGTANFAITGFYVLKPMGVDATLTSGLDGWSLDDDKFGSVLNEYFQAGKDYTYVYFGADTNGANKGIAQGDNAIFNFAMSSTLDAVDWTAYANITDKPHIFVRWQQDDQFGGDSAKGYDWFRRTPNPGIPEPSHIAGMAMLGLGALLFVRRRLTKK